jgi:CMP/dCMP kinase
VFLDGVGSAILRDVSQDENVDQRPNPDDGTRPASSAPGLIVAVDGPSSSGKSTVGAEAATRLGYRFCDTGLLYRAVTWLALERGVESTDLAALVALADEVRLEADDHGRLCCVQAAGRDVTTEVRGKAVEAAVSEYSRVAELRAALIPRQREIASDGAIIMAGRDIGTVILPDADLKVYLDASAEERARRRAAQRAAEGMAEEAREEQQVLADLKRRDTLDSTRVTAPLRAAPDAVVLHSDALSFEETVEAVVAVIRAAERPRAGGESASSASPASSRSAAPGGERGE